MLVPRGYEEDIAHHKELFSKSALELGRIHWYIQKADTEMSDRCFIKKDGERDPFERTPFGNEVGRDEICWWVFKRETEIEELKKRTETVLKAAQTLKEDSFTLRERDIPISYQALIETIRNFAEAHKKEIHALHEYVVWLNKKSVLAPGILFTYRVWGSTRLSDRMIYITAKTVEEDQQTVERCVETACGLRISGTYTVGMIYSDVRDEIMESIDDEYQGPVLVPRQRVIRRTLYKIRDEMATYFEFLRQSLRNILIDIDKYNEQMKLLYRETFWRSFILKAMSSSRIESQSWDFKKTLEMWHAEQEQRERAKVKFCEEVASFANTKGGVLIIGVTNDPPRRITGIPDLENKLKFAKEVLSRSAIYDSDFTHFQQVLMKDEQERDSPCLVIAVAQTKDVVSVKDQQERHTFPRRLETGIDRTDFDTIKKSKKYILFDNYNFIADLYSFLYDRRFHWSV